jgi:hypothetical protein
MTMPMPMPTHLTTHPKTAQFTVWIQSIPTSQGIVLDDTKIKVALRKQFVIQPVLLNLRRALKVSLLGGFVVQLCQRECILVTISSTS